jgi:branched-chain amino acid transport system permease protein
VSGYLSAQLAILCINVVVAYAIFLPAASGQLNLGAAGFMIIGSYTSAWLNSSFDGLGLSMWISIPLAALATGAVGFLISFPILRTRGVYMVLATFAFAEVVAGITLNLEVVGAAAGFPVDDHAALDVLVPVCLAVILFCVYLFSTRLGLAMRSIHDDETVAQLFGINVRLSQVAAFTIGAAIGGLAGALYGHHYSYIEVQNFNVLFSIYVLLYVLLGGTQTVLGPLVGALFFTAIPEFLRYIADTTGWELIAEARFAVFGALIVLMMVVRPEGVVTRTMLEGILGGRRRREVADER